MHLFLLLIALVYPVYSGKTAVLILARGGSKGIPLKNIQTVGGISLLARTLLTAKKAGFEDVSVSTDHYLIALEALKYNATVFKRSYVTATDWAPSIWGVAEFLENKPEANIVVLLQTTSPFIKAEHLASAFLKLNSPVPYDCIFSVSRSYKLRWSIDASGSYPLNFNHNSRPRRQDWDGELVETGGFYIFRRELVAKGLLQNNNCTVWEVSPQESLEIDTIYDLILANTFMFFRN